MAAGWSVMDALNKNSKAAAEDKPKARFRTRDISIRKMYSNDRNFYSMQDIDTLAQDIMVCGMIENLTVTYAPCEKGEYRIIAGERRWRALMMLVEKGYSEFEIATCQIRDPEEEHEEIVQIIMANAYRDKTVMDILEEEKQLKESLQYMKENGLTLNGYKLDSGRLRDVIAQIMNTTTTKVAQIESINKRLIPEFSQELREGRLTFSAAYELSGMKEGKQKDMLGRYRENGLTWKEVREAKAAEEEAKRQQGYQEGQQAGREVQRMDQEKQQAGQEESWQQGYQEGQQTDQEESWQQAHPESITSLCYSCQRYSDCNVKTGTCRACDRYINKAEYEKADEQRYKEEQERIDRETREKLSQREQDEVMQNLPSARKKEKAVRISAEMYKNVTSGQIPYMIVKEGQEKFREKEILLLIAFTDGKTTGEQTRVCVTCVDTSDTSSGIVAGYAVIGVMDIYDAEAMGMIDLEDED